MLPVENLLRKFEMQMLVNTIANQICESLYWLFKSMPNEPIIQPVKSARGL